MAAAWKRTSRLNLKSARAGWGTRLWQMALGVAVEVSLAGESRPSGEDGQGDDLAFGEGGLGAGSLFWRMGVAEVVNRNVKCGEEGVLRSSIRSRFLSLGDRVASRL